MPLPAGFKVNGSKVSNGNHSPISPRAKKMMAFLDRLPASELLTTSEITTQLGLSNSGSVTSASGTADYREKVDGKLFWGSRKSIAQLRKQLAEPEESDDQN